MNLMPARDMRIIGFAIAAVACLALYQAVRYVTDVHSEAFTTCEQKTILTTAAQVCVADQKPVVAEQKREEDRR